MLVAASGGKTVVFDENTYGCAGGGVGLCFGDAFTKNHHPTEALLSMGDAELAARPGAPKPLAEGERFYATKALVKKWKDSFPFTTLATKYVVFCPLSDAREDEPPALVQMYANPDQLSALVIMAGFERGAQLNVVAPFAATCQSIVLAYQEIGKPEPRAILGWFDISNSQLISKELLSFTVPFALYAEMERGADKGCLTTSAWARIAGRFEEARHEESI
jgi:hypothetical protein